MRSSGTMSRAVFTGPQPQFLLMTTQARRVVITMVPNTAMP